MVELLYLLDSVIPNFEQTLGEIGVFILIFGVVNAFFGYRLFKVMLSIIGFLVGAAVGSICFLRSGSFDSNTMIAWVVIGGLIGAALAGIFHGLGVFLAVGFMGAIAGLIITQDTNSALVFGGICGIAGVVFEKYVIIVTTALSGGTLAATGFWFAGLSSGENLNARALGWIVCICGLAFQLWREKRGKTNDGKETDTGIAEDVIDIATGIVGSIMNALSSLRSSNPKEVLHNIVYKKDSNEVKTVFIKSLLGLPIVVGIILGILFSSGLFGCGVITALYVLIMVYFIQKIRAENSPEGYVQKYAWEKWVNEVLDKNLLILFAPLFPGFFIFALSLTFTDDEIINLLFGLLGIIGSYVIFFRAIPSATPKEETNVPAPDVVPEEEINSLSSDVNPKESTNSQPPVNTYFDMQQKTLHCPNCGTVLIDDSVFCSKCGSRVQAEEDGGKYVFCSECGAKLPSEALFCDNCGAAQSK